MSISDMIKFVVCIACLAMIFSAVYFVGAVVAYGHS
jgi:hypothetical protein